MRSFGLIIHLGSTLNWAENIYLLLNVKLNYIIKGKVKVQVELKLTSKLSN